MSKFYCNSIKIVTVLGDNKSNMFCCYQPRNRLFAVGSIDQIAFFPHITIAIRFICGKNFDLYAAGSSAQGDPYQCFSCELNYRYNFMT